MNFRKIILVLIIIFSAYRVFAIDLPKAVIDLLSSLFSDEFAAVMGSESVGGNVPFGYAVNAYVDRITGQVIRFGNIQDLPSLVVNNPAYTRVAFIFDVRGGGDRLVDIFIENPEALSGRAKVVLRIALDNYGKFAREIRAARAAARAAQQAASQQVTQQPGRWARFLERLKRLGRGGGPTTPPGDLKSSSGIDPFLAGELIEELWKKLGMDLFVNDAIKNNWGVTEINGRFWSSTFRFPEHNSSIWLEMWKRLAEKDVKNGLYEQYYNGLITPQQPGPLEVRDVKNSGSFLRRY